MSKYFQNMNGRYQKEIIQRLEFTNTATLKNWLVAINILRNKCAHHARIWNRASANPISLKGFETDPYFQRLNLSLEARRRIYGQAAVIWYFVRKIGPSSDWIKRFADLVDSKPALDPCPYTAMGFPDNSGFPRELFGID